MLARSNLSDRRQRVPTRGVAVPVSKFAGSIIAATTLLVASCSSSQTASDQQRPLTEADGFGQPADALVASRMIEIDANDDFSFGPDAVDVKLGETVTFSVTNTGKVAHEFTLGPTDVQLEHKMEMTEMGDMEMTDEPNAISVAAGETAKLTWEFTNADPLLFGCHIPGHYDAGMVGDINVQPSS